MEIILQTTKGDKQIDEQSLISESIEFKKIESSLWDGEMIINYIIPFTPALIASIVTIVVQNIRARKHVKIIDNGVEIHGLSAENAKEILETIYANRAKKKSK